MSEGGRKVVYAVGATLLTVLIVLVALRWWKKIGDEDRPPIIVKGGSVIFELRPVNSQPNPDWVGDGGDWKPDQPGGHSTREFVVTIDTDDKSCQQLRGPVVHVFRTPLNTAPLNVIIGGGEPRVGPKGQLTADNSAAYKKLTYSAGDLTGIRVANKDCSVSNQNTITIQPARPPAP